MKLLLLSAADIEQALPIAQAIEVIAGAYAQLSAGRAQAPQRAALAAPKGISLFMPAYLPGSDAATRLLALPRPRCWPCWGPGLARGDNLFQVRGGGGPRRGRSPGGL